MNTDIDIKKDDNEEGRPDTSDDYNPFMLFLILILLILSFDGVMKMIADLQYAEDYF